MTDTEFDIIDELYFVSSFSDLAAALTLEKEKLSQSLENLLKQGYVKSFFPDPDTEVEYNPTNFQEQCSRYFF